MYHLASDAEVFIPVLAIGGAFIVAISIISILSVRSIVITRTREQTKRELAAYVAEGTMDAKTAIAMANAGVDDEDGETKDWL